jgi:DNA-binding MarR family transcriptional regulator
MSSSPTSAIDASLEHVSGAVAERVRLFRLLVAAGNQLRALMDRRFREDGITTQQAAVLAIAGATETPLTQGEVARRLGVSHQNIRQLADSLVRKGLLEVRADPADRRVKQLVPTRRVPRMFARRNDDDFAAISAWFSSIDDREAKVMQAALHKLLAATTAELARAPVSTE